MTEIISWREINNEDLLQREIDEKLEAYGQFYGFSEEQWVYFPVVGGDKINIPCATQQELIHHLYIIDYLVSNNGAEWEKLIEWIQIIQHLIDTYKKNWYTEKLYPAESSWTKWDHIPYIDLRVDNRDGIWELILWDTIFFTHESLQNIFPQADNRDMLYTQKLADFLNKMLWLE